MPKSPEPSKFDEILLYCIENRVRKPKRGRKKSKLNKIRDIFYNWEITPIRK